MKLHWLAALLLGAAACLLLSSAGSAGDKKDGKKKVEKSEDLIVEAELINADVKDKVLTQSYCKIYTFKMTAGKTYQIDMKSQALDSFLRLENAGGTQVAQDDDSGGMLDARIVYKAPKTEDYSIIATSLGEATGKFTLIVKELKAEAGGAGKTITLKNEKGQATYTGNIAQADPLYKNKKHKRFVFPMEAGKTYQIDHMSKDMDCYLYLEDPDGNLLAEDDDGGEGFNSRISHKAEKAGNYRIVATSLSGRQVGQFNLTVRQTDPAPKEEEKKK